jgi:hypothetical protein
MSGIWAIIIYIIYANEVTRTVYGAWGCFSKIFLTALERSRDPPNAFGARSACPTLKTRLS